MIKDFSTFESLHSASPPLPRAVEGTGIQSLPGTHR